MAKVVLKENLILIVDENISRRDTISSRLRHQGYDTELSSEGFHTIHLVEKSEQNNKKYQMIFIVCDMVDMPGREILNLVRNVSNKKQLPILMMDKKEDPQYIAELLQEGINDYIQYTENFQLILKKIQKWVPLAKK